VAMNVVAIVSELDRLAARAAAPLAFGRAFSAARGQQLKLLEAAKQVRGKQSVRHGSQFKSGGEQIGVAAKLRCAVEHASLAAHQQGTDLVGCHRRKDFPYPARDQANPRSANNVPKAPRWRASAPAASCDTIP